MLNIAHVESIRVTVSVSEPHGAFFTVVCKIEYLRDDDPGKNLQSVAPPGETL